MENKAVKYDELVKYRKDDELGLFEKYDNILEEVRDIVVKSGAEKVIDIGCGTGNLCGPISNKIEVIGIDKSTEMMERAKEKYSSMKFKLGNFLDEAYAKGTADVVVTSYAFHGIKYSEKEHALNNMVELLKRPGKIIIVDFIFENEREKQKFKEDLLEKGKEELWEAVDCKYYTYLDKLKEYSANKGFKITYRHIVNFTWIIEIIVE